MAVGEDTATYLIDYAGFAGFLWIGLYAVTRGDRGRTAYLTGATAVATCCFFFFNCWLKSLSGDPAVLLNRCSWWASIVPATLWLQLSLVLDPHAARSGWRTPVAYVNIACAGILAVLGTFTDLERDYSHSTASRPVGSGPLFALYVTYVVVALGLACLNLSRMEAVTPRDVQSDQAEIGAAPERSSEIRLLAIAAICFLAGAGYLTVHELADTHWDQWPGLLALVIGLGIVSVTIALRSALLLGKDLRLDCLHSFTAVTTMLIPGLAVMDWLIGFGDGRRCLAVLLVVATITAGYTLHESLHERLDVLFFTPPVRHARAAARAYEQALATQPTGISSALATSKEFEDAVRRALTHLPDPTRLATSPLLQLRAVGRHLEESGQEDNRLNRTAALREMLIDLLDGLRPVGRAGGVTGDAYRYYNCLYYPYVLGIGRRRLPAVQRRLQERRSREGTPKADEERVVDWLLQQDEATFYRWQRRASDTIAAALSEREAAAGGSAPMSRQAGGPES